MMAGLSVPWVTLGDGQTVVFGTSGKGRSRLLEAYERAPCVLDFTVSGDERALADWSAVTPPEMLEFLQAGAEADTAPERVLDVEQGDAGLTLSVVVAVPARELFLARLRQGHPLLSFEVVERGRLMAGLV